MTPNPNTNTNTNAPSSLHRLAGRETEVRCHSAANDFHIDEVRRLLEEFRLWLAGRYAGEHRWVVQAYFDEPAWRRELASLPGIYHSTRGGELLIAWLDGQPVGTVAMRALDADRCEMKRMYVSAVGRGRGIGDLLVDRIVGRAAELGFAEMVLDTGFRQHEAASLYRKHGFEACSPYYDVDHRLADGGLTFMRKRLEHVPN